MSERFCLEKAVWDETDFDLMGWHDATVYGMATGPRPFELVFDLDYIFAWIKPGRDETRFKFWVAPCTLIFQNVTDVEMDVQPDLSLFQILEIVRSDPGRPRNAEHIGRDKDWRWTIEGDRGGAEFRAVGFKQYVRRVPVLSFQQTLDLEVRGGVSFTVPTVPPGDDQGAVGP